MGRVMDNKTYEALKATAYPEILFTLSTPLKLSPIMLPKTMKAAVLMYHGLGNPLRATAERWLQR